MDGAANRLYNCHEMDKDSYIPDFISGDFDSAPEEILDYYKSKVVNDALIILSSRFD